MLKNASYDLYCPQCQKKADVATPIFIRGARSIKLPIFLCGGCQTIYIDKSIVRRVISEWRKQSTFSMKWAPFEELYKDLFGKLEEAVMTSWVPRLGYKRVRFLKRFTQPKP